MIKKTKKGFTLVELLVVIAILAILASVSVVGYLSFTKKAELSNDQTMIKMINDNLMAEYVTEKPSTAGEAIEALENLGVSKQKLVAYSGGYHYAYNLKKNSFVLLDNKDEVVYPEGASKDFDNLWGLYFGNLDDSVGLSNYVALDHINNLEKLNNLVKNQSQVNIDLKNNYFKVENYDKDTVINLTNGYLVNQEDNPNIKEDETVIGKKEVIEHHTDNKGNKLYNLDKNEYDNVIFDNTKKVESISTKSGLTTFKNCVFISDIMPQVSYGNISLNAGNSSENLDLVFDNCIFINVGWLQTWNRKITVKNSEFINCMGGVSIKNPTLRCEIVNNKFDLTGIDINERPNNAPLMLAPDKIYDANGNLTASAVDNGLTNKFKIEFSGNTIENAKSIIRLHEVAYKNDKNYKTIDVNDFNISNNKIIGKPTELVGAWWTSATVQVTPNDECLKLMEELAKLIK